MASAEVVADWAWISKDPSEGIGYSVLKVSTGAIDFGAISGNYEPGAPNSTTAPDAPDAPPWVTYGLADGGRDGALISVSVRDPWTERDHTGRPVWPQRLLTVRYAQLAAVQASFQTIWAAVQDAPVPAPDGAPLPLTVAGQSLAELITVVEANFDGLATIAAALLDGPVAVADASHLTREQRLALFDAVAALLPYGYRADLSASSSVNNTVKHRIRLVLADFANPDQQVLSLLAPEFSPRGEVGRRYLAALHEKRQKNGTATLVRHLWRIKGEDAQGLCSFRRPGFALAALRDLDFLGSVRDALAKGPVPPELIHRFFADPDGQQVWDRLDVTQRDNAVRSLAGSRDASAAILLRGWQIIGDEVISCANRDLDAGRVEVALACLSSIGQADGQTEDRALAKLLVPEHVEPEGRDRRSGMLIKLLRQRSVPAPGEYPYTCDYLRFGDAAGWQARLVRDLLTSELAGSASGERALGWVSWLCRSPFSEVAGWERPEWVTALDFPGSGEDRGSAVSAVRPLIQRDQQATPRGNCWSAVLVQLSTCAGRLIELLEAAGPQLMELSAALPPGDQGPLAVVLRADLRPSLEMRSVRTLARVDVMRALLDLTPSGALTHWDETRLGAYLSALREAFRHEAVRRRLPQLEETFLRLALVGAAGTGNLTPGGVLLLNTWADDPERQQGLIRHMASLSPQEQPIDVRLSQKFWTVLGDYPALADYAASGQLITATDWTVRHQDIAFRRKDTEEAVTSTRLARACYEAWCKGGRAEGIIRTLASAGAAEIPPPQLDDMLREFQGLLYLAGVPGRQETPEESEQALFECWRLIVAGMLGPEYAQTFGEHLHHRLSAEIDTRMDLLKALSPHQRATIDHQDSPDDGPFRWAPRPFRKKIRTEPKPQAIGTGSVKQPDSGQRGSHAYGS
jgi:hypothetical protein